MEGYQLSEVAARDLGNIYEFGISNFGLNQADVYLMGLNDTIQRQANYNDLGRDASVLYPSLKGFNYKAHMIFYIVRENGILIVRVLHHSMDYKRHF